LSFELALYRSNSTPAADALGFDAIDIPDGDRLTWIQDAIRRNGFLDGEVGELGDDSVLTASGGLQ